MRVVLSGVAFVTLLAGGSSASAQADNARGFYVAAGAGLAKLNSVQATYYDVGGTFGGTGTQDTLQATFRFKDAFIVGGAIGYDFGVIRPDLEVSYARNSLRSLTIDSVNGSPITLSAADREDVCDFLEATCGGSGNTFTISGSRARQLNAMANIWFDLPLGGMITPYAGGGVGIAGFEIDGDGKAKFAWQLGAGVALNVSRNLAITADYRHREASKANIDYDASSGIRVANLKTDSFMAGVRLYFAAAAAAAPEYVAPVAPPPPPAPATQTCPDGTVIDAAAVCAAPPPPPPPPPAATKGERG
jgi:opacity protein-like surface antigen